MKRLVIISEVLLTNKEAKKIEKTQSLVWDVSVPIASIFEKDIKFVSARLEAA